MANWKRLGASALALFFVVACTPSPEGIPLDEHLSSSLPHAQAVPLELFGLGESPPAYELVGPDAGVLEVEDRTELGARNGTRGGRSFIVGETLESANDPSSTATSATLDLVLYEHPSEASAHTAWLEEPPEWANRAFEMNTAHMSDEEIEDSFASWKFDIAGNPEFDWHGICLTGSLNAGEPCHGFEGWVRFCRWTMGVSISVTGWDLDDPRIPQVIEHVVGRTAHTLGCIR